LALRFPVRSNAYANSVTALNAGKSVVLVIEFTVYGFFEVSFFLARFKVSI
jgi:hypothetical protein